eukprot:4703337-Alexandrium_andersonii.AAC.1
MPFGCGSSAILPPQVATRQLEPSVQGHMQKSSEWCCLLLRFMPGGECCFFQLQVVAFQTAPSAQ